LVEKVQGYRYPTGITRLLFRAPLWLYNLHLGWLLGNRFLKLTHTGRISGRPRQVVLEVVKFDPRNETYYVAAAWGEKSDWVKNIQANPQVEVQVGTQKWAMQAEKLTPQQGAAIILDYGERHPAALVNLARFMGYRLDGSEADFRDFGQQLLMFSLAPPAQEKNT
jgi:deazaflavin-dependent oxidoreductase (nitroreductase family)